MATTVAMHVRVDQAQDVGRPEWHRDELHVAIGPLHLVLTEHVAVAFVRRLEALVEGHNGGH